MSGCFIANRITHNSPASRHLQQAHSPHQLVMQWDLQQCDTDPMALGVPAAWYKAAALGIGGSIQDSGHRASSAESDCTQGPPFRPGPTGCSYLLWAALILAWFYPLEAAVGSH